ncbi:MAG: CerR family C-terminal domain-containing protein [Deferrisomatales bacterium]
MASVPAEERGTRERLLAAAERLFAERGYEHTTVREITEAAGANVAAVHYHFGSKENLYLEVFRVHADRMAALREAALAAAAGKGPGEGLEAVLRTFVGYCLRHLLAQAEADHFPRIVFREVAAPGPAFDFLFRTVIQPNSEGFRRVIRRAVPGMDEQEATLCVASLFGLMLHFVRARRVVERLSGRAYDEAFVEEICEHIVGFALRGMGVAR